MPTLDKWDDPLMGKNALWKMNSVKGISFESEDNDGILTFISDNVIQQATNEEIYWQADFGGYVFNQEGVFVWDEKSLEWIKSSQLIDETITDNAEIFFDGENKFVLLDGNMRIVTAIERENDITKISISTNETQKFVWDSQNWEVWYPEKTVKEIPVCESLYDVLTPRNELNPDHIVEAKDFQSVANWVQTQLTEDMFDLSKIKLLTDVRMSTLSDPGGEIIVPNVNTAPNYKDPLTSPFLKDNHWCASTVFDDKSYLVIFVPYYIPQVTANELPVIVGIYEMPLAFRGAWRLGIESYLEDMNVVPWYINTNSTQIAMQYFDPYTGENFTLNRIQQIFSEMQQGDFSDTHGLVLYFNIGRTSSSWYE